MHNNNSFPFLVQGFVLPSIKRSKSINQRPRDHGSIIPDLTSFVFLALRVLVAAYQVSKSFELRQSDFKLCLGCVEFSTIVVSIKEAKNEKSPARTLYKF
jgi:hypothetical protein